MEKIPNTGPALIVYYHGALPIDIYYLIAKGLLYKDRQIQCVGDRFLFKIPGKHIRLSYIKGVLINKQNEMGRRIALIWSCSL